jgi:energy-coupling factor transporter ATP-binding protein EcfA2
MSKQCAACFGTDGVDQEGAHKCPQEGKGAIEPGFEGCPVHTTLVWTVGRYSFGAYRACGTGAACQAGKGGKPWRYLNAAGNATPGSAPKASPAPSASASGINLKALGSLGDAIQSYVDARARELATEITAQAVADIGERGPITVNWTVNDRPFAKVDGVTHKALPRLLKLYAAGVRNFLLVGPAGSGKTTLCKQFALALSLAFAGVSCSSGMSESQLTGRLLQKLSSGEGLFQSTEFVRLYETSGVFLLDEVDGADANVLLVANSATANGHLPLPNRTEAPEAARHADSVIVCAANTYGTGADRQYVGRNQLDAAFLDRFVGSTVEIEYDRDLEASLVGDANICARVWKIREKVAELKLRRIVGTRFLLSTTRLVRGAGDTLNDALLACTVGWTTDERTKAGVL